MKATFGEEKRVFELHAHQEDNAFFSPNYIPIALQFAKDKIEELGLPSVTLMNIGSIGGHTDGSSKIAQAIDDFVSAGHPIVCGDDGGKINYTSGEVLANQQHEIQISKGDADFFKIRSVAWRKWPLSGFYRTTQRNRRRPF